MPHIALYVPDEIRDPNPKNAYINTIEYIDSEVGRLLVTLNELNLSKNTYVIYTTDNSPWLSFLHHGGSAGPLHDGKGTTFEGGQRVPCVMCGLRIPAGTVCNQLMSTIDLLPTFASITGKALPRGRKIDGVDASGLLTGKSKAVRNEFVHYTSRGEVGGIRQGKWKLLAKKSRRKEQSGVLFLFDLEKDLSESQYLTENFLVVVKKLKARILDLDAVIERNVRKPWLKE